MRLVTCAVPILVTWLAAAISVGACVDAPPPDPGQLTQPIVNGIPATADVSVVALINRNTGVHTCSGTVVAPRVVLTAAHCLPPYLSEAFGIFEMTDLAIYFGDTVGGLDPIIGVAAGKANLMWDESALPNDIGILYLESEAPVPAKPMNMAGIETIGVLGTEVRAVGYGTTGPDLFDNGTRLQGTLLLDSADTTNTFATAFPGSLCPGDSGGALFSVVGGIETLIAVASRGDCIDVSIHERVDAHYVEFIEPFLENPFDASCASDELCATGCAAPDPDCPCADDGFCDEQCPDIASDPDCSATCTALDGVCGGECEFQDLDCRCADDGVCGDPECLEIDPDCAQDSGCGCQSGGSDGGGALLLLIALGLIARRSRRGRGSRRKSR